MGATVLLTLGAWVVGDKRNFLQTTKLDTVLTTYLHNEGSSVQKINCYKPSCDQFMIFMSNPNHPPSNSFKLSYFHLLNEHVQQELAELNHLAFILLAVASIVFTVSLLGYCGALQESRTMLTTYALFLLIVFSLQVLVRQYLSQPNIGFFTLPRQFTQTVFSWLDALWAWCTVRRWRRGCGGRCGAASPSPTPAPPPPTSPPSPGTPSWLTGRYNLFSQSKSHGTGLCCTSANCSVLRVGKLH